MTDTSRPVPTRQLIADLAVQLSDVMAAEILLLRAELGEASAKFISGLGWLAGGLSILLAGLVILLGAAVALLMRLGTPPDMACLLVAIGSMAIGGILVASGIRAVNAANLVPARSFRRALSLGRLIKGH
jgi:hypothetical protein